MCRACLILFFCCLLGYVPVQAQQLDYNARMKQAYQAIFKLKLKEGQQWLDKEKQEHPANYFPYFLENYVDFLKLFINDNEKLYKSMVPNIEARLLKLEAADDASPYYLYTLADLHLQWAFCKIKFGEYLSAVFEVKKAFTLLQANQKKFPDFTPNLKSLGLLHTLFGAVPDKYKFGLKLLGMKGSIEQGLKELNTVLQDDSFEFREETIILYTLLMLHLQKDSEEAWNKIELAELPLGDNLLNHFIAATVAAHTGKNDKVISILSGRPVSPAYHPFPFLDLLYGSAKLQRLDEDADVYLKKFMTANKGRSYQKEACRKLAWYYLLNDNPAAYKKYMQQLLTIKDAPTDEDKSAQREAERGLVPQLSLLKARVLFDGGYYARALDVMQKVVPDKLSRSRDRVEYYYRKARIYHEMKNMEQAVKYYLLTLQKGENYNYYFSANACIKLGGIFEAQKKPANAALYYQKAIDLDKDEYHNSIEAEAKAGLNRLGK